MEYCVEEEKIDILDESLCGSHLVYFFQWNFLDSILKFNASTTDADVLKLTVLLNRRLNASPDAEIPWGVLRISFIASTSMKRQNWPFDVTNPDPDPDPDI